MTNYFDILLCPSCQGDLSVNIFDDSTYASAGILVCKDCGQWYPISDGIPRLLIPGDLRPDVTEFLEKWKDRLTDIIGRSSKFTELTDGGKSQVQATFSHKWTRQSWWGMEGESAKVMEEWLLPRYGWPTQEVYQQFMESKKTMLDAGCGLGREALRMARANPDALVIGLELSDCVDEAARHAREQGIRNVFYIQADLTRPPFRIGIFDFIISEGVLHHTPDTRQAFQALVPLLAPGGEFAFYVYRKKAPLREYADDYIRQQIQDLPPDRAWEMMEPLTELGRVLSELRATLEITDDIEVLGIKAGKYDLQRLIYYNMFKCYWNGRLTFDENVLVNFDWYYPRYAWRHTEGEIRQWLRDVGLELVHESIEDAGITVRGKKC